ncbi:MAG: hypothetical protein ACRCZS_19275 [Chroococcidiopsis sp.]
MQFAEFSAQLNMRKGRSPPRGGSDRPLLFEKRSEKFLRTF